LRYGWRRAGPLGLVRSGRLGSWPSRGVLAWHRG